MFAQTKQFILAHKKGLAVAAATVTVAVVAYRMYTKTDEEEGLLADVAAHAAEAAPRAASVHTA